MVGSWTFLGVNMHFNEKLFMCDSCNFLVRAYQLLAGAGVKSCDSGQSLEAGWRRRGGGGGELRLAL